MKRLLLVAALCFSVGCSGEGRARTSDAAAAPKPVDIPSVKAEHPGGASLRSRADPEVTLLRPTAGARLRSDEPLLCSGTVRYPPADRIGLDIIILECGVMRGKTFGIMSTTRADLRKAGPGLYRFEARIEPTKLPPKPGKYVIRAVYVEWLEPEGEEPRTYNAATVPMARAEVELLR